MLFLEMDVGWGYWSFYRFKIFFEVSNPLHYITLRDIFNYSTHLHRK
jgi:hypothetical protein